MEVISEREQKLSVIIENNLIIFALTICARTRVIVESKIPIESEIIAI